MVLKAILTDLSSVDESLQQHYTERDGRFYLNVEAVEGYSLEDVSGLKTSLSKERQDNKTARKALNAFEGMDADEARNALSKMSEVANWTPEDKVREQIEAQAKQLTARHSQETEKLTSELDGIKSQLQETLIRNSAIEAITAHKGNVNLLLPHIEAQTRMEFVDGKFVAQVIDENGVPRVSMATGSTDNMSIDELVSSMKSNESYMPAFAGSGATGSGATGSSTGSVQNGTRQMSWQEAHDPQAYRAAKEAANNAGSDLVIQPYEGE